MLIAWIRNDYIRKNLKSKQKEKKKTNKLCLFILFKNKPREFFGKYLLLLLLQRQLLANE